MSELMKNHYKEIWQAIQQNIQEQGIYEQYIIDFMFNDNYIVSIVDKNITVACKLATSQVILDGEKQTLETAANQVMMGSGPFSITTIMENEIHSVPAPKEEVVVNDEWDDHISSDFTFDNFVVGPSNKQAQAAALGCAYSPGNYYNPLFIYGDSGLGKTHLLHAIGNYVKKKHPEFRVLYLPTGDLISLFYDSTKSTTTQDLMDRLKSVDVLLLDDIQFLAGKEKTNTFFFQIYNSLVSNRKQIVLTSDKSPYEMNTVDIQERLVSRFSSGLTVTITSPEFSTRYEILKMKVKEQTSLSENPLLDDEALTYIAANSTGDVRKLEGLLNQMLFYQVQSGDLDTKTALKEILKQEISEQRLDPNKIIRCVGDYYHLTKQQLLSKSRSKNIVTARHMAMYLVRKELDEPFHKIGSYFGGCDHTTVMSACTKMENLIKKDSSYQKAIQEIENRFM